VQIRSHRGYPTPVGSFWEAYPEHPELYDRFALSTLYAVPIVHELVDFRSARVLDVASGTGKNAIEHAKIARWVIGIEPMPKMRDYAIARAASLGIANVEFRDGIAEDLSAFSDDTFDVVTSMHGAPFPWDTERRFLRESERVVRKGGHIVIVGTTPSWRPQHLRGSDSDFGNTEVLRVMGELERFGFVHRDVVVDMEYGTQQEALETFGFIYGPHAIDYILDRGASRLEWSLRIYTRTV